MTEPRGDVLPTPKSLERAEAAAERSSRGVMSSEDGETSDSLPESIEEFIRDRFSTKLEDPDTGRRIR